MFHVEHFAILRSEPACWNAIEMRLKMIEKHESFPPTPDFSWPSAPKT
jgi:hypothetical protein